MPQVELRRMHFLPQWYSDTISGITSMFYSSINKLRFSRVYSFVCKKRKRAWRHAAMKAWYGTDGGISLTGKDSAHCMFQARFMAAGAKYRCQTFSLRSRCCRYLNTTFKSSHFTFIWCSWKLQEIAVDVVVNILHPHAGAIILAGPIAQLSPAFEVILLFLSLRAPSYWK